MSNKDLIWREDALNIHVEHGFSNYGEIYINLRETIEAIKNIPAVPHEMSARELYSAYMRICEEYNHKGKPVRCYECPLYVHCPRIGGALRMVVMCSPIVEKWEQKHPETGMERE